MPVSIRGGRGSPSTNTDALSQWRRTSPRPRYETPVSPWRSASFSFPLVIDALHFGHQLQQRNAERMTNPTLGAGFGMPSPSLDALDFRPRKPRLGKPIAPESSPLSNAVAGGNMTTLPSDAPPIHSSQQSGSSSANPPQCFNSMIPTTVDPPQKGSEKSTNLGSKKCHLREKAAGLPSR